MWRIVAGLAAFLLLGTGAAQAEWRRAESPNFILFGDLSESALRERALLLEDFDRLLRALTPGQEEPAPNRLHVYIFPGRAALNVVRPGIPAGIAGFYMASDDGILAMIDGSNLDAGNEILFHEYAHHFMRQNYALPYPAWYVEGFAEYFSTARFTARKIDIGQFSRGRVAAITGTSQWLPMERMLSGGPLNLGREQMSAYYAQAWLMTHYFYSNPERQATLGRLLAAQRGASPVEALRTATGLTPEALTRELRAYIGRGSISYRQMDRGAQTTPPPVTVTMLPRAARELMAYEAALRVGIRDDNAAAYLQQVRTIAARFPDDPLAMRVQANIELRHGNAAVADRLLDQLLVASPGDAELLYLKGMRWLIAEESDNPPERAGATARQWFGRAQRADQNHWQTLYRYALSLRGEPAFLSENTRNAMLLASQLAPQVYSITMNAASLLIARREYAQAIALLTPLTGDPHNTGLASAARELVGRAQAAMRAAQPAGTSGQPRQPASETPPGE